MNFTQMVLLNVPQTLTPFMKMKAEGSNVSLALNALLGRNLQRRVALYWIQNLLVNAYLANQEHIQTKSTVSPARCAVIVDQETSLALALQRKTRNVRTVHRDTTKMKKHIHANLALVVVENVMRLRWNASYRKNVEKIARGRQKQGNT